MGATATDCYYHRTLTESSPRVASRRPDRAFPGPKPGSSTVSARSNLLAPAGLGLLGALLAALGSWNVSLWTDEAATISAARRSTADLWQLVHHIDAVHALYYFAIHFWGGAFGWSAFSLRLPSALAAGVTVVGVWALARALDRPEAAVVAGIVAAVLPRLTWAGVEARSFGPSAAVAVWATVVFVIALRSSRRWWIVYGALLALGIALNIYLALVLVAHAVTLLVTERRRIPALWPWLAAAAAAVLAASPVVAESLGQRGQLGDTRVSASTLVRQAVVNEFFLGQTPTRVGSVSDGHSAWSIAASALAAVCWALTVAGVVVQVRRRAVGGIGVLVPWLVVPTLVVAAYSLAASPLYNPRYFTFCAPAAALLIALGIRTLPRWWMRGVAVLLVVALSVPIYWSQRQETGKSGTDWSAAAAYVAEHARVDDGVYFAPLDRTTTGPIERTTRNIAVAYPDAFANLKDVTLEVSPTRNASLRGLSAPLADRAAEVANFDTVWVVRPADYPAASSASDAGVFARAGFHEAASWRGPMDAVLEFTH